MSEGGGLYKRCDRLSVGTTEDRGRLGILFAGDASEMSRVQVPRHLSSIPSPPQTTAESQQVRLFNCLLLRGHGPFRNLRLPCIQSSNGSIGSLCCLHHIRHP